MTNLDQQALAKAFDSQPEIRAEGRDQIVSGGRIEDFYECADFAQVIHDSESLEFWLVEVATSREHAEILAKAIFRLAEEVLAPQRRFHEGAVYLEYIARAVSGESETKALDLLSQFESQARIDSEISQSETWKTLDISQALELGQTQQHYYDRFLAYFSAVHAERMVPLFDELKFDYLPNIFGYFIGLTTSIKEKGVKSETAIKAFRDYQALFFNEFRPGIPRQKNSSSSYGPAKHRDGEGSSGKKDISGYGVSKT